MEILLPFATAFLIGSLHAFEPDHMAAVTSFAVRRPRRAAAVGFGLRWAVGHGGVILVAGAILLLLGVQVSGDAGHWLERLVGAALIALGAWNIASARAMHAHRHTHGDGTEHLHLHSHALSEEHRHGHTVTAIGALHGLAGTAPVLALLAVTRLETPAQGIAYLILFAAGTIAGMVTYALFAGWLAERVAGRSAAFARCLAVGAGAVTMGIGAVWLLR